MRVAYPRGGPHVLALFYSSWQKGHGILARTWEQAEKVFRSDKFQRHIGEECDLRVERALDIDIVSAPPSWRREIAAKVYREERVNFRNNLLRSVRDLPTLPRGFSRCPHYAPGVGASSVPIEDEYRAEHFLCDTCDGSGIVVTRSRLLEVYARAAVGDDPLQLLVDPISAWGSAATAPPAEPGRELMVLMESRGVTMTPFSKFWLNTYEIRHTICHFHVANERTDVVDGLQSAVAALYADLARPSEDEEQRAAEYARQEAAKRDAKNEALRRFLG